PRKRTARIGPGLRVAGAFESGGGCDEVQAGDPRAVSERGKRARQPQDGLAATRPTADAGRICGGAPLGAGRSGGYRPGKGYPQWRDPGQCGKELRRSGRLRWGRERVMLGVMAKKKPQI